MPLVKMGCDNCGNVHFYDVPMRNVIEDAERDIDEPVYSHYHKQNRPDDKTFITCLSCGLAYLKTFWWNESEELVKVESRK